jgi:hypothetical protein
VSATENAIDDAITAHAKAEGETGVVTGWVAIASVVEHDGEDERSGIVLIYPGGSMPWPQALGIVEAGRIRMQDLFRQGEP